MGPLLQTGPSGSLYSVFQKMRLSLNHWCLIELCVKFNVNKMFMVKCVCCSMIKLNGKESGGERARPLQKKARCGGVGKTR